MHPLENCSLTTLPQMWTQMISLNKDISVSLRVTQSLKRLLRKLLALGAVDKD